MGKGSRRERQAVGLYQRAGWITYRPATVQFGENDVFGLFDVLAIEPTTGAFHAVQVKSNGARGLQAWSRHVWPFRAAGMRTLYAVPYDGAGWRVIDVEGPGETWEAVDGRPTGTNMGDDVVQWLRSEAWTDDIPTFVGFGERRESGSWDNYECPGCGAGLCSFTKCPVCGWYDGDAWEEAVRKADREHDGDVYTGGLDDE